MARDVYEASYAKAATAAEKARIDRWLRERAYPLVRADYERFWMNPRTRFDARTGLNHHWDDIDLPRPERHGADNELALGRTYRDTRAAAESGLDFTDLFENQASAIANPLLNSMLYKTEQDLGWAASRLGLKAEARKFRAAAARRRAAVDRHLWNAQRGRYEPLNLATGKRVNVLSADTFSPLFVGMASPAQAARVRATLAVLERPGGLMATDLLKSAHQWDGINGWAPYQVMAIRGLERYGFAADGRRLADKWVHALAEIHARDRTFYERIDVARVTKPNIDAHKYPPQEGFLWTNGSFAWAAPEVLDARLRRIN
jgi:alpha,alpha-trehalase